jgi:glycosyltransferase involved in cell wall biosynthesis
MNGITSTPRILHLSTARSWRGGEAQVLSLALGLRRLGAQQWLSAPPDSPLVEKAAASDIATLPLTMRGEFDLIAALRLRRHLRNTGCSIVHAHTAHAHALGLLATTLLRGVHLVVSRRVNFAPKRNPLSAWKYRNKRQQFIAISQSVKTSLESAGVLPSAIEVIYSGVDLKKFAQVIPNAVIRQQLGIPPHSVVAGTIAALTREKGISHLIDAAAENSSFSDLYFLVIGSGPDERDLKAYCAERNCGARIIFTGFRSDIGELLAAMDLFVFPSLAEGLGTSVLDAMLSGLPVVASDTGGIAEMVINGENGLLVPPGDGKRLAKAIALLYRDHSLRRQFGERSKELVRRFSIEHTVNATYAFYQRFLLAKTDTTCNENRRPCA